MSFMNLKTIFFILLIFIFALGCATQKQALRKPLSSEISPAGEKAYQFYLNGALDDFQYQYENALIEYFQALLYDSSSAQIFKAIARDYMRLQRNESAIQYLKKAIKLDPGNAEILNYLGEAYFNQKNYGNAIVYFEKLLKINPYNTSVQNNLLYLYSQIKDKDKIFNFYKNLMNAYPDDRKRALQFAMIALKQKRFDEAQKTLTAIVQKDSTQLNAYFVLGNLFELKKDTAAALAIYRKILKQEPSFPDALSRLYRIYRSRKDWKGLEETYLPLVAGDSLRNPQARLILAESYYFQKKSQEARQLLKPILDDSKYRPAALELLGRISLDKEEYPEAEKYFTALTKEDSENSLGWVFLSLLYNRQKKYQESISVLQQALNIHSKNPDILSLYGSTLNQMGKDSLALKPLNKALKINPNDINTLTSLAAVYDKLKMWKNSDSLYEIALKKNPDNALLLNNYSYSLCERGIRLADALEMAKKALKAEPDNGAYLDTIGWIYFQMGQYEQARDFIGKALKVRENSEEVMEHMGDVYYKLKQAYEARKYWQKAFDLNPQNTKLKQKIDSL